MDNITNSTATNATCGGDAKNIGTSTPNQCETCDIIKDAFQWANAACPGLYFGGLELLGFQPNDSPSGDSDIEKDEKDTSQQDDESSDDSDIEKDEKDTSQQDDESSDDSDIEKDEKDTSQQKMDIDKNTKKNLNLNDVDIDIFLMSGVCNTRDECKKVFAVQCKMLLDIRSDFISMLNGKMQLLTSLPGAMSLNLHVLQEEIDLLLAEDKNYSDKRWDDDELKKLLKTSDPSLIASDFVKNSHTDLTSQYQGLLRLSANNEMDLLKAGMLSRDNLNTIDELNKEMSIIRGSIIERSNRLVMINQDIKRQRAELQEWSDPLQMIESE